MSELTDGERAISRARSLMANKGYGWSKAVDRAADTLSAPNPIEDMIAIADQLRTEYDVSSEVAALLAQALYAHRLSGRTGQRQLTTHALGQLLEA